jgi:hypothetical protein
VKKTYKWHSFVKAANLEQLNNSTMFSLINNIFNRGFCFIEADKHNYNYSTNVPIVPILNHIHRVIQAQYLGLNNTQISQFCLDALSPTCYHVRMMQQISFTYYYAGYQTKTPQAGGGFVCL